jgi:hypothetical protein
MTNLVDKKCISTEWYTPPEILEPVRKLFGGEIGLDPCTSKGNPTQATIHLTPIQDGLSRNWRNAYSEKWGVFVNPPYGKSLYDWIHKVTMEAEWASLSIVLLVSASSRWDQKKWQRIYSPELTTFVMPVGRVKFLDAEGNRHKSPPYPSVLYFYNIDPKDVKEHFGHLGTVVRQEVL